MEILRIRHRGCLRLHMGGRVQPQQALSNGSSTESSLGALPADSQLSRQPHGTLLVTFGHPGLIILDGKSDSI